MNFLKNKSLNILLLVTIFFTALSVNAWTGPTSAPPNGNTGEPLNISNNAQTKAGYLYFPKWFDANNDGYYVDPDGNSWLNRLYSYDIRSSIFYDLDNTSYYIDPSSTSKFNTIDLAKLRVIQDENDFGGIFQSSHGLAFIGAGVNTTYPSPFVELRGDSSGTPYIDFSSTSNPHDGGTLGDLQDFNARIEYGYLPDTLVVLAENFAVYSRDNSQVKIFADSSGNVGIGTAAPAHKLDVAGNIKASGTVCDGTGACIGSGGGGITTEADTFQSVTARGNTTSIDVQSNASMRAPIFYDLDNTNYYINPSSTSVFNSINLGGVSRTTWPSSGVTSCSTCDSRFINVGESGDSIADGTIDGSEIQNNTLTALDLAANSAGNSEMIDNPSFTIFYDANNSGYYVDPASTSRMNTVAANRVYGYSDIRSPIFYDSNNTGYYVNPASTSNLNSVYISSLAAGIMYDSNSGGYYVDPASTSRMNAITPNSISLGGVSRSSWPSAAPKMYFCSAYVYTSYGSCFSTYSTCVNNLSTMSTCYYYGSGCSVGYRSCTAVN